MKKAKVYKIKTLIDGKKIGLSSFQMIAVPDKGYKDGPILVKFGDNTMLIKNWHKARSFRRFHDNFGGKDYTLAYFTWIPDTPVRKDENINFNNWLKGRLRLKREFEKKIGAKVEATTSLNAI